MQKRTKDLKQSLEELCNLYGEPKTQFFKDPSEFFSLIYNFVNQLLDSKQKMDEMKEKEEKLMKAQQLQEKKLKEKVKEAGDTSEEEEDGIISSITNQAYEGTAIRQKREIRKRSTYSIIFIILIDSEQTCIQKFPSRGFPGFNMAELSSRISQRRQL